jgi:hypothetical protein
MLSFVGGPKSSKTDKTFRKFGNRMDLGLCCPSIYWPQECSIKFWDIQSTPESFTRLGHKMDLDHCLSDSETSTRALQYYAQVATAALEDPKDPQVSRLMKSLKPGVLTFGCIDIE